MAKQRISKLQKDMLHVIVKLYEIKHKIKQGSIDPSQYDRESYYKALDLKHSKGIPIRLLSKSVMNRHYSIAEDKRIPGKISVSISRSLKNLEIKKLIKCYKEKITQFVLLTSKGKSIAKNIK